MLRRYCAQRTICLFYLYSLLGFVVIFVEAVGGFFELLCLKFVLRFLGKGHEVLVKDDEVVILWNKFR